jgi:hypothetical protein
MGEFIKIMNVFHAKKFAWFPFTFLCPRQGSRLGVARFIGTIILNTSFFAAILVFLLYSKFGGNVMDHVGFTIMWMYTLFGGYYLFVCFCWDQEHGVNNS